MAAVAAAVLKATAIVAFDMVAFRIHRSNHCLRSHNAWTMPKPISKVLCAAKQRQP